MQQLDSARSEEIDALIRYNYQQKDSQLKLKAKGEDELLFNSTIAQLERLKLLNFNVDRQKAKIKELEDELNEQSRHFQQKIQSLENKLQAWQSAFNREQFESFTEMIAWLRSHPESHPAHALYENVRQLVHPVAKQLTDKLRLQFEQMLKKDDSITKLEIQIEELKRQHQTQLEEQALQFQAQIDELKNENINRDNANKQLQDENQNLKQQIESLRGQISEKDQVIQTEVTKNQELSQVKLDLEVKLEGLAALEQQVAQLQQQNDQQNQNHLAQVEQLTNNLSNHQNIVNSVSEVLVLINNFQSESYENIIARLNSSIEQSQSQLIRDFYRSYIDLLEKAFSERAIQIEVEREELGDGGYLTVMQVNRDTFQNQYANLWNALEKLINHNEQTMRLITKLLPANNYKDIVYQNWQAYLGIKRELESILPQTTYTAMNERITARSEAVIDLGNKMGSLLKEYVDLLLNNLTQLKLRIAHEGV